MEFGLAVLIGLIFLFGAPLGLVAFFKTKEQARKLDEISGELFKLRNIVEKLESGERAEGEPLIAPEESSAQNLAEERPPAPTVQEDVSDFDDEQTDEAPDTEDVATAAMSEVEEAVPVSATASEKAESTIGGKLSVWVGGITMALGSIFLVGYAIEAGFLGPAARIAMGVLFGAVLCLVGEFMRRRNPEQKIAGFEWAGVPEILTAIGTFAMFAAVFAAHGLYELIGPATTFIALGVIALVSMAGAMLHGPALASLGLIGAFVVPLLISSNNPQIMPIALYILIAGAAAITVARLRLWRWLAVAAAIGWFSYALLFQISATDSEQFVVLGYLIAASVGIIFTFVVSLYPRSLEVEQPVDKMATLLVALFALSWIGQAQFAHHPFIATLEIVLLVAVPLALACYYSAVRYVVFLPIVAAIIRLAQFDASTAALVDIDVALQQIAPDDFLSRVELSSLGWVAVFLSVATFVGSLWASIKSVSRAVVASGAMLFLVGVFVVTYGRVDGFQTSTFFALVAFASFVACRAGGEYLAKAFGSDGERSDAQSGALAAFMVASLTFLGLAAAIFFENASFTVAMGLLVPAMAFTYWQHRLFVLRALTPFFVIPYGLRVFIDPLISRGELTETPFFNVLTYGYGVPTIGFIYAALVLTSQARDVFARLMQAIAIAAVAVSFAMIALHLVEPTFSFAHNDEQLLLCAVLVLVGGGISLGLTRLASKASDSFFTWGSIGISLAGVIIGALGLFVWQNPVWTGVDISQGLILNELNFAYLLPFFLYGLIAWQSNNKRPRWYVIAISVYFALLGATWINFFIHHIFHPGDFSSYEVSDAQQYTYSAVWLLIGIGVLSVGLYTRSKTWRAVSGLLIALVVLKVFLIDMSELTGFLRALSFISLGAVLMAIGYFYQRILSGQMAVSDGADDLSVAKPSSNDE
ncbi:MAG: DUF2339 domain-containing protein [Hyphomicrobiales bacterium]